MWIRGVNVRLLGALLASSVVHSLALFVFVGSVSEIGFSEGGGGGLVARIAPNKPFNRLRADTVLQRVKLRPITGSRDIQKKGSVITPKGGVEAAGKVYLADQVDMQPEVDGDFSLDSMPGIGPQLAGEIEMWLLLSRDGRVDWVSIVSSDLPEEVSNGVAVQFTQAAFHPAVKDNEPVAMLMHVIVTIQAEKAM